MTCNDSEGRPVRTPLFRHLRPAVSDLVRFYSYSLPLEGQKVYEAHKRQTSAVWRSIDDFILHEIFNFHYIIDHETGKRIVDLHQMDQLPDKVVFTLNDFPYDREPEIEQVQIWNCLKTLSRLC
jgi:hypothetical protein